MKHTLNFAILALGLLGAQKSFADSCYFKGNWYRPNTGLGSWYNCGANQFEPNWAQVRCSRGGVVEYFFEVGWDVLNNEPEWKADPSQCYVAPRPVPLPEPVRGVAGTVVVNSDTYFKASRADASSLPANQKCRVPAGTSVRLSWGIKEDGSSTLKGQIGDDTLRNLGCSFGGSGTVGFFYLPAVSFGRIPNVNTYCSTIGESQAVNGNNTNSGWYCLPSYRGFSLSDVCAQQFGSEYSADLSGRTPVCSL